jgi:hypothetical protein
MNPVRHTGIGCLWFVLAMTAGMAHATATLERSGCNREDAAFADPGPATRAHDDRAPAALVEAASASSESAAILSETAHTLPTVTVNAPAARGSGLFTAWALRFVDHLDLGQRLRSIKRLKIVPLFDDARLTVYFGINHAGVAGLHFQQQDRREFAPIRAAALVPAEEFPTLRAFPQRLP